MRLKKKLVYWLISQKVKSGKRTKKFVNLASAKTAGIIYRFEDRIVFEELKKTLGQKQIKCTELCFVAGSAENMANCISKKDFNFWGMPKSKVLTSFLDTEFDLLIDLSLSSSIQLQVIRALSRASFKTGWSKASPDFFDLSIDVSKRREPSFLAEQLIHYLNEIK